MRVCVRVWGWALGDVGKVNLAMVRSQVVRTLLHSSPVCCCMPPLPLPPLPLSPSPPSPPPFPRPHSPLHPPHTHLPAAALHLRSNVSRDRGPRAFLEAAGAVCVLFVLSWRLAPPVSLVIVVTAVAAALYRRSTRPVEAAQSAALQRMAGVAQQAFSNMRTVRSFAGEALERERFQAEVAASFAAGRQFGAAKAGFEATNRLAIHLSLLALYAWGGWLVAAGALPVGALVSGIGFTFSLMYATQGAVNTLSELRRASGAFERVRRARSASSAAAQQLGWLVGTHVVATTSRRHVMPSMFVTPNNNVSVEHPPPLPHLKPQ